MKCYELPRLWHWTFYITLRRPFLLGGVTLGLMDDRRSKYLNSQHGIRGCFISLTRPGSFD